MGSEGSLCHLTRLINGETGDALRVVSLLAENSFRIRFIYHLCYGKNRPRFLIADAGNSPPQRSLQSSLRAASLMSNES